MPATVEACAIRSSASRGPCCRRCGNGCGARKEQVINSRTSSSRRRAMVPWGRGRVRPNSQERSQGRRLSRDLGQFSSHCCPSDQSTGSVPAVPQCALCKGEVVADEDKAIRHRVFDLPPITGGDGYLRLRGVCSGCGHKRHRTSDGCAQWSAWTARPGAGGDAVGSVPSDAGQDQRLLERVMGLKFSIGTISMAHGHVAQAWPSRCSKLQTHLSQEPVRRADETSHKATIT